jgi:hypothetical protein
MAATSDERRATSWYRGCVLYGKKDDERGRETGRRYVETE